MTVDFDALFRPLADEEGKLSVEDLAAALSGLLDSAALCNQQWQLEKREFLLREAFWKAGAREADFLAYRYRQAALFDEQGNLLNAEELVALAKEELPDFFPKRSVKMTGVKPQEGKSTGGPRQNLNGMSYAERADLLAKDPDLYRRLRNL
ncbi:MAG: hypothetical protein ACOX6P_06655 [Candidatus Merdivicinus sp.]|jgi:hypothetical protein